MDWLHLAKQIREDEQKPKSAGDSDAYALLRKHSLLEPERSWSEKVQDRAQQINQEGFPIRFHHKGGRVQLAGKGEVTIELCGHLTYAITYRNIRPPSKHIFKKPITIHHHRVVKVKGLSDHNIEEIMKYLVLGVTKYWEVSTHSRMERNLDDVIESQNLEERE
jgi:hypothetical protein